MTQLTQEIVRELISYDPETGIARWKPRSAKWFKEGLKSKEHSMNVWNKNNSDKILGSKHKYGFIYTSICGKKHKLHRLIFLYMTGEFPNVVDHIDGDPSNNKWDNLRNVSQLENTRNSKRPNTNTSGVVGVVFDKSRNKWTARIHDGRKMINLGRFSCFYEAIRVRKEAEIKYGYHPNHGR